MRAHSLTEGVSQAMTEGLTASPTWQTNLDDKEKAQCLEWAAKRFTTALQQERTHVLGQLRTINELLGRPEIHRADVIAAILGEA